MARKNPSRPASAPPPGEAAALPASQPWWPEEFASPRRAAIVLAAIGIFGILLLGILSYGNLHGFKRIVGWLLGLNNPYDVSGVSSDVAMVAFALAATAGAALVHPSLGLGVIFLMRSWLDGYTYPTDNAYFLWATMIVLALWAARLFLHGGRIRGATPLILFAAFLAVAILTGLRSVSWDLTYRQLLYWFMYAGLLVLALNMALKPGPRAFMLAAMLLAIVAQSLFAVLHFEYLLPYMRRIIQNPQLLQYYFGTNTLTPELARRFEINRAFGSLLFPNALAAFLILALPYTIFRSASAWREFPQQWRARTALAGAARRAARGNATVFAAFAWFLTMIVSVATLTFIAGYSEYPIDGYTTVVLGFVGAMVPAAIFFYLADRHGAHLCGHAARAFLLPPAALLMLFTLWLTFSRGGMLALLAGLVAGGALYAMTPERRDRLRPRASAALGAMLVLAVAAFGLYAAAHAGHAHAQDAAAPAAPQTPSAAAPPLTITAEGRSVGAAELANPESFRLRLTYWQVGLRMFWDNLLTGTGFGTFKIAYPHYQYLGAGNVKEAHNGFLQMFCETGLFGGLLYVAFWAWWIVWGAARILGERDSLRRLGLAGLYAGIVAFLLHSAIDINFSHTTLMTFAIGFIGAFYGAAIARCDTQMTMPEDSKSTGGLEARQRELTGDSLPHQFGGLALMAFAALAVGLSLRPYLQDLSLSRLAFINIAAADEQVARLQVITVLTRDMANWTQNIEKQKAPSLPAAQLAKLIPDYGKIREMGALYAPDPKSQGGYRPLGEREYPPPGAAIILNKPNKALKYTYEVLPGHLAELERIDRRFPYSAEFAMYVANWYSLIVRWGYWKSFADVRRMAMTRLEHWAAEIPRRATILADAHAAAGDAWWTLGEASAGGARLDYWRKCLDEYRRAAEINTVAGDFNLFYAFALNAVGDQCAHEKRTDEAAQYHKLADEQKKLGDARRQARWNRGL